MKDIQKDKKIVNILQPCYLPGVPKILTTTLHAYFLFYTSILPFSILSIV